MLSVPAAVADRACRSDRANPANADEAPEPDEAHVTEEATQTAQLRHLLQLLASVAATGYRFTTPTPLTHQRAITHRAAQAGATLRDIFGWSLPFDARAVPPALLAAMASAGILQQHGDRLASALRIATLGDDFFLHSAYPTSQDDAVFFGPDSYRFARFIQQSLQSGANWQAMAGPQRRHAAVRILDVGCGSGAGGVVAARALAHLDRLDLIMNDINPLALQYTAANAAFAGIPVALAPGDALSAVAGQFDLIISNPPYLNDDARRAYRHGGARLGRALSARIAAEALGRLAPGGQLLLYTGVAIVDGVDPLRAELLPLLAAAGCDWSYTEIDPDVFGEELEQAVYAGVDRIAAVGLTARRKGGVL